ncbi:MAG TPA: D-arabinono-1,4-lactone oxidase [Pyrinomonadaceae bacterium]
MKILSYLHCGFATTLNILVNAVTFGRVLWLEGRVTGGRFKNWARNFVYSPPNYVKPTTEQEIIDLVQNSSAVRFFGSAHSFNDGVVTDHTLVSLDEYAGLIWKDLTTKRACFKGGTRIRDVVKILLDDGLAFQALPSHDAQSIAGILSTDVHGTGGGWGWVSEMVVELKIIDGLGSVHQVGPSDDLFKAAIGGIGAVGIIAEVTVQAVDRFNVEQKFELMDLSYVRANLDQMLQDNDHLSLYLFPFSNKCQVSIWNRTTAPKSPLGTIREWLAISFDALVSAWFGNFMAYMGLLDSWSNWAYGLKQGTNLVLESNKAFNRSIYHLHQELEFTVPYADTWQECDRFLQLFESMYTSDMPYTLLEVRFTPAGHDQTLIGAGRDRRSTWIDLICNDSYGFEAYYAAAEVEVRNIGARPHLGKFCATLTKSDLQNVHGAHFDRFLQLMAQHDPQDKFANSFTRRLFRT